MRKIAVARFCRTLSTLLSSGVPILDGLDITARTSGNSVVEEAILMTRKSIERGETISAPLKETGVFPPMVTQMIAVGETTGALDTMLSKIADFYEEEVDTAVAGLLTLLEPIMIAFLGGVVGGIVIAMYLPIFDLISKLDVGAAVAERDLRRKLFWLIAIRVGISTLLLGSAVFVQLTSPGTFPGEPLFLLIGITYGLNILWLAHPQMGGALQLDRRFPARVRRADRLGLHRRHRRHHQLLRRALRAADRGRQQRAVPPRRDDDCDAERAAVCRHRADAVLRAGR